MQISVETLTQQLELADALLAEELKGTGVIFLDEMVGMR
jgi:hypothetical protein